MWLDDEGEGERDTSFLGIERRRDIREGVTET